MHDPMNVPEPRNSAFFPNKKQGQNRPTQPVQNKNQQLDDHCWLTLTVMFV